MSEKRDMSEDVDDVMLYLEMVLKKEEIEKLRDCFDEVTSEFRSAQVRSSSDKLPGYEEVVQANKAGLVLSKAIKELTFAVNVFNLLFPEGVITKKTGAEDLEREAIAIAKAREAFAESLKEIQILAECPGVDPQNANSLKKCVKSISEKLDLEIPSAEEATVEYNEARLLSRVDLFGVQFSWAVNGEWANSRKDSAVPTLRDDLYQLNDKYTLAKLRFIKNETSEGAIEFTQTLEAAISSPAGLNVLGEDRQKQLRTEAVTILKLLGCPVKPEQTITKTTDHRPSAGN